MRISSLLFVIFTFFLSTSAQATLITVNDGDQFSYDVNDTYLFTGSLSNSNQILTYGVNVDPGEIMSFVVNAPTEFDLQATLSTGPNGTGTGIITPNGSDVVYAGTSFEFPIDGFIRPGVTQWLAIAIGSEAISLIDEIYGGAFEVSSFSSGDSFYQSGGSTGGGSIGDGGYVGDGSGSHSVPEPSILMLIGVALLGFGSICRKNVKV